MNAFLYPAPELPDETPLERVRFSTRIRNGLKFGGLETVGEVRSASDVVLLRLSGPGSSFSTPPARNTGAEGEGEMTANLRRAIFTIEITLRGR
jgi:hypothetical protein